MHSSLATDLAAVRALVRASPRGHTSHLKHSI